MNDITVERPDAEPSVVVFLGPSLAHACAREILPADYRAPAQMGDIYQIIASGVRTVVLIDGIFHAASEVWQREILEAMAAGIRVIGASSMGALRAAELHGFGMIGVGQVFEWYRDRVIDGDDEVAIMHADASEDFRALSEPLVNIRYRLEHALARRVLTEPQARALIAHAKETFFPRRSNRRLLAAEFVQGWPEHTRARLAEIFRDPRLDLKTCDARRSLEWVADALRAPGIHPPGHPPGPPTAIAAPTAIAPPSRFYLGVSKRKRGFFHPGGFQVTGEMLWRALEAMPAERAAYRREAAKNHYLRRLADHLELAPSPAFRAAFRDAWETHHQIPDTPTWRAASGLTRDEYSALLDGRATIAWMLARGPDIPGVASWSGEDVDEQLARAPGTVSPCEAICLVAWARIRGIARPDDVSEAPDQHDQALCQWLLAREPYHFGYTSWSPVVAVLEELQVTGRAAHLVREYQGRHD